MAHRLAAGAALAGLAACGGRDAGELLTATVDRGSVSRTVSATGTLKALVTVQVGSQVTGVIQSLGADFNSVVRTGQVIARIDPANFAAQLERAQADLASAEARVKSADAAVRNQRANAAAVKANLGGARAARDEAERALRRSRELAAGRVLSPRDLEAAESAAEQARARVEALEAQIEQSEAQVRAAEAQLEEARAQVAQSRAAVSVARVNLEHTIITSPIDGVVISRNVDVGQTVAASLQAPTLFVIANDLARMNVIASIDEADIGVVSEATGVSFTVDAFPGETFSGRVRQVRLEPQTQQNVVTYSVIIDVDNPELKLRPGMTANVTLTIAEERDVLRVPNAALRYWPEDVPRERARELLAVQEAAPAAAGATGSPARPGSSPPAANAREGARAAVRPGTGPQAPAAGDAEAILARLRDPGLSPQERRAAREAMRALPAEQRERLRERLGGWGGPGGRGEREGAWDRPREGGEGAPRPGGGSTAGGELRFPPPAPAAPRPRIVWVRRGSGPPQPVRIEVGISDGRTSAVVAGDLKQGDVVVTGRVAAGGTPAPRAAGAGPLGAPGMGGIPRR